MSNPPKGIIRFPTGRVVCSDCRLAALCVPGHLPPEHVKAVERLVRHAAPLRRGECVFRSGERVRAVYAVLSGSVRSYRLGEDGGEKVIGFRLAGEVLGFDGVGTGKHRSTAEAIEVTAVCELPINELQALADRVPELNHHLYYLMSEEIGREQETLMLLSDRTAAERLAGFLLDLGKRFAACGRQADEFQLSMSRQHIANYLGLTVETVSRSFSQLQKAGLIAVRRRHVCIGDRARLKAFENERTLASSSAASPSK